MRMVERGVLHGLDFLTCIVLEVAEAVVGCLFSYLPRSDTAMHFFIQSLVSNILDEYERTSSMGA
jgi:hypothetical protein